MTIKYQLKEVSYESEKYRYLPNIYDTYKEASEFAVKLRKDRQFFIVGYKPTNPVWSWIPLHSIKEDDTISPKDIFDELSPKLDETVENVVSQREREKIEPFASISYELYWSTTFNAYLIKWTIKYTLEYQSRSNHKLYFPRFIIDEHGNSINYGVFLINSNINSHKKSNPEELVNEIKVVERSPYLDFKLAKNDARISSEGYANTFREIRKENSDKLKKEQTFSYTILIQY